MICVGLELEHWDDVKDGLQLALDIDNNKYTLDNIKNALDAQYMQLWGVHDGILRCVFVTQVVNYPNLRVLECIGLHGKDPEQWIELILESMEEYAKESNCALMETGGRRGWEKMFKQHGWGNARLKMSKRIDYGK